MYYHHFNLHFQVNLLFFLTNSRDLDFTSRGLSPYIASFYMGNTTFQSKHDLLIHFGYTSNQLVEPSTNARLLSTFTLIWFYQLGLCLVHSPLLETSLLFSFPSLIDMLKLWEFPYSFQIHVCFLNDLIQKLVHNVFQFKNKPLFDGVWDTQKMKFKTSSLYINIIYKQRMLKRIYN